MNQRHGLITCNERRVNVEPPGTSLLSVPHQVEGPVMDKGKLSSST